MKLPLPKRGGTAVCAELGQISGLCYEEGPNFEDFPLCGGGRGPVAPPVFKTGLAGIALAGRFDSFPPPPIDLPR